MLGGGICGVAVGEVDVDGTGVDGMDVLAGLPHEAGRMAQINSAGKCHEW
jgi:hypothetical protein